MKQTVLTQDELHRLNRHIDRVQRLILLGTAAVPLLYALWCRFVDGMKWDADLAYCVLMNLFVMMPICAGGLCVWAIKREDRVKVETTLGQMHRPRWQKRLVFETQDGRAQRLSLSPYHFIDRALYEKLKDMKPYEVARIVMLPEAKIVFAVEVVAMLPQRAASVSAANIPAARKSQTDNADLRLVPGGQFC